MSIFRAHLSVSVSAKLLELGTSLFSCMNTGTFVMLGSSPNIKVTGSRSKSHRKKIPSHIPFLSYMLVFYSIKDYFCRAMLTGVVCHKALSLLDHDVNVKVLKFYFSVFF